MKQIFLVIYFYLIMAAAFVALLPAACAAWLFPARCGDYPTCHGTRQIDPETGKPEADEEEWDAP